MAPTDLDQIVTQEVTLVKLAREIAADLHPIDDILSRHSITMDVWERIKLNPRFQHILEQEQMAWESALNTHERSRLKAASAIEEWLPEAYAKMHDPLEPLNAKTEVAKLVASIAGMGRTGVNAADPGSKFTVTINIGQADPIKIEKDVTPKVIAHE